MHDIEGGTRRCDDAATGKSTSTNGYRNGTAMLHP